ncbi:MAG: LptA/OstA family protein [Candidatus Margulisbacteria bacterium]|nr:LptA/OstA family protein [Candidatus Margulisiibacteriota bacterium]
MYILTSFIVSMAFADSVSLMADYMKYDNKSMILASGNVQLYHKDLTVNADTVVLYTDSNILVAQGHVSMNYQGRSLKAESLQYNIKSNEINFNVFSATFNIVEAVTPLFFECENISRKNGVYYGGKTSFSSCPPERQYYVIQARKFVFYPEQRIEAYDVYAYTGMIPVFYSPYYEFQLGYRNPIYLYPIVGDNRVEGTFIKSALDYNINRDLRALILIDLMSNKGLGLGVRSDIFPKSDHPLNVYAYAQDENDFAVSFKQKLVLTKNSEITYAQGRRNLYQVYGSRDDYWENNLQMRDSQLGNWNLYNKEDYFYIQRKFAFSWDKQFDKLGHNLDFNYDNFVGSRIYYLNFSDHLQNEWMNNNLFYRNSDYQSQKKRTEYIDDMTHMTLGENWVMDTAMHYGNNVDNGNEDQFLNPRINLWQRINPQEGLGQLGVRDIQYNVDAFIDVDGDKVTTDANVEYRESLPEVVMNFQNRSLFGLNYTPILTLGSYHERKFITSQLNLYHNRMLLQNRLGGYLYRSSAYDISAEYNYDQYLYETGDKQFAFNNKYDLTLLPQNNISNKITFFEAHALGYTPFYFDEIRSRQNRLSNVFSYLINRFWSFRVEDGYDFVNNARESQRYYLSYNQDIDHLFSLTSGYDYQNQAWNNLQGSAIYRFNKENSIEMNTNYNLKTGFIDDSHILTSYVYPVDKYERWIFQAEFLWNNINKQYRIPSLRIRRDMNCVEMIYEWNDYKQEHVFMFRVNAFPNDSFGIGYGNEGLKLKGLDAENAER